VQTTLVPSGGAAIVEMKLEVPGDLIFVDHSIFRAFNKGALGMITVAGAPAPGTYSGKQHDVVYLPEGGAIQAVPLDSTVTVERELPRSELLARGEHVFQANCAACHQPAGQGVPGAFPPLAKSDFLMADRNRAISVVMHGRSGAITVNGTPYNGVMPSLQLSNTDIAAVLSYVRSAFGNNASDLISIEDVRKVRAGPPVKE